MNINELIERAHSQAKAMGWWDEKRNAGELLMLIVSECGEALEAHRNERRADMDEYDSVRESTPSFEIAFKDCVKDTFEDELADIVIRIADYCGSVNLDLGSFITPAPRTMEFFEPKNVGEGLLLVTKQICNMSDDSIAKDESVRFAIGMTLLIAQLHDIDLERHIDLKLKYNLTRGYKHGKTY